ncbi:MAG: DUF2306 domain-containing protein [Pseudomonadota bacterium]
MNWDVFTKLSPLEIQIHWATVTISFVLGLVIFGLKKGTGLHKLLGWSYVTMMIVTMVAAFFIRNPDGIEIAPGLTGFSWIHLFIPLTTFGLAGALIAIKRKQVKRHARAMIMTFLSAMLIAGLFTLMPGRLMHQLFFSAPSTSQGAIDAGKPGAFTAASAIGVPCE